MKCNGMMRAVLEHACLQAHATNAVTIAYTFRGDLRSFERRRGLTSTEEC